MIWPAGTPDMVWDFATSSSPARDLAGDQIRAVSTGIETDNNSQPYPRPTRSKLALTSDADASFLIFQDPARETRLQAKTATRTLINPDLLEAVFSEARGQERSKESIFYPNKKRVSRRQFSNIFSLPMVRPTNKLTHFTITDEIGLC